MNVRELMNTDIACCSKEDTLEQAARLMWEEDAGCLVVIEGAGIVIGMITDRDLAMAAYTTGKRLADIPVERAMSRSINTCSPDANLSEVEGIMRKNQIRRVPVVDAERRLLGIVSLSDLAKQGPLSAPTIATTLAAVTAPRQLKLRQSNASAPV